MAKNSARLEALQGDRCPRCNGSRTVVVMTDMGFGVQVDCPDCKGTGLVNSPNACTVCKGAKTVVVDMGGFGVEARCNHCNGSGLEPKR